jgi:hypothetical protein
VVAVSVAGRAEMFVESGCHHVEHPAEEGLGGLIERESRPVGLRRRDQAELGDETVILERHLAVDTARKGVVG